MNNIKEYYNKTDKLNKIDGNGSDGITKRVVQIILKEFFNYETKISEEVGFPDLMLLNENNLTGFEVTEINDLQLRNSFIRKIQTATSLEEKCNIALEMYKKTGYCFDFKNKSYNECILDSDLERTDYEKYINLVLNNNYDNFMLINFSRDIDDITRELCSKVKTTIEKKNKKIKNYSKCEHLNLVCYCESYCWTRYNKRNIIKDFFENQKTCFECIYLILNNEVFCYSYKTKILTSKTINLGQYINEVLEKNNIYLEVDNNEN